VPFSFICFCFKIIDIIVNVLPSPMSSAGDYTYIINRIVSVILIYFIVFFFL
jgi:hypothetical protein